MDRGRSPFRRKEEGGHEQVRDTSSRNPEYNNRSRSLDLNLYSPEFSEPGRPPAEVKDHTRTGRHVRRELSRSVSRLGKKIFGNEETSSPPQSPDVPQTSFSLPWSDALPSQLDMQPERGTPSLLDTSAREFHHALKDMPDSPDDVGAWAKKRAVLEDTVGIRMPDVEPDPVNPPYPEHDTMPVALPYPLHDTMPVAPLEHLQPEREMRSPLDTSSNKLRRDPDDVGERAKTPVIPKIDVTPPTPPPGTPSEER